LTSLRLRNFSAEWRTARLSSGANGFL
jgi:hypothetical protein